MKVATWKTLSELSTRKLGRKLSARLLGYLAYKRESLSNELLDFINAELNDK